MVLPQRPQRAFEVGAHRQAQTLATLPGAPQHTADLGGTTLPSSSIYIRYVYNLSELGYIILYYYYKHYKQNILAFEFGFCI